jgi:hypothetical protein
MTSQGIAETRLRKHALVVGHPGHELRAFHWMERTRPLVLVVTDGSGRDGASRIESTRRVLAATGGVAGGVFGQRTDRAVYDALLRGDATFFVALAEEILAELEAARVESVAGDAAEGFNPTHDVCRLVLDAVVNRLRRGGREIRNYSFALAAAPDALPPEAHHGSTLRLDLEAEALARKLEAARQYPELEAEVNGALARFGDAAFARETLWEAPPHAPRCDPPPAYEIHGERRVAQGAYGTVLRARHHVLPVASALAAWAADDGAADDGAADDRAAGGG